MRPVVLRHMNRVCGKARMVLARMRRNERIEAIHLNGVLTDMDLKLTR